MLIGSYLVDNIYFEGGDFSKAVKHKKKKKKKKKYNKRVSKYNADFIRPVQ